MKKGFTLIELLVVVLIIGILSSVGLPQYMKAVEKARAAEAIQLLGDLARAETAYFLTKDAYTTDLTELDVRIPSTTTNFTLDMLQKEDANGTPLLVAQAIRNSVDMDNADYYLWFKMDDQGKVVICCQGSALVPVANGHVNLCDENGATDTCKSIANNISGILRNDN